MIGKNVRPEAPVSQPSETLKQALAHHQAGRLPHAAALYRAVLQQTPRNADARHLFGLVLHQQGHSQAAVPHLQQAIALKPGAATFRNSLGAALRASGQLEAAVVAFEFATQLQPHLEAAWLNWFGTVREQHEPERELAVLDAWVERTQGAPEALRHRAAHRYAVGDVHGALADHEQLAQGVDDDPHVLLKVGVLAHELGDDAGALAAFRRALATGNTASQRATSTTRSKLDHDIEQFDWLRRAGSLPEACTGAAEAYRTVRAALFDGGAAQNDAPVLSPELRTRIAPWYVRPLHVRDSPAIQPSALASTWNADEVEARYRACEPGVTWVDGLLTSEALDALRAFCRDSMIWNEYRYKGGYVGASLLDGFFSPLLLQIARELRERLPGLLGAHPLRQMWAFKYDQERTGIGIHADSAAVNVNFWITPDEANLDPSSGGLCVWRECAPLDWDFDAFNRQPEALLAWLKKVEAEQLVIPYRSNRAVLFNSNLIHCTDAFHFAPGYDNRRINITMLFGVRGA